jgi:alpha-tubulin suppressor-like RCC1 family protein
MPAFYNFTENGLVYSFDDVFVPADLFRDGNLWTWGLASQSALGNGVTTGDRLTPVTTFAGGANWRQVSGGYAYTAAIKTDGTLWGWGSGSNGRLGNAQTTNRSTPVTTFTGGTNWKQVSGGSSHCVAIKTDGTLWTWGYGNLGRLGNGATTGSISTPVTTFTGGTNWKQVSSGSNYTAAIKTDGTLWTWGWGSNGRLGNNSTTTVSTPVTTFTGGTNWRQVSCGEAYTAAIKTDGTLWTWGYNGQGQLGDNTLGQKLTPITTFAGGTNWKQVDCGRLHTLAIKTDGTLWSWGRSAFGALGRVQNFNISTPVTTFAGGTNWAGTATGGVNELYTVTVSAAIKSDGTLWTWGFGTLGELGNNTQGVASTPVTTFSGGTNWRQIASGGTAAIKTDGTLWLWGFQNSGRLGNGAISSLTVNPITTFAGGTNWRMVSTNTLSNFTAAIKTDGTLWVWGNNNRATLGDNTTINKSTPVTTFAGGTNWSQVSCGRDYTAAIKTDGTLWTWGYNQNGVLGNGYAGNTFSRTTPVTTFAGGTNWKQISCGRTHVAAVKTDGTLWTWGYLSYGKLGNTIASFGARITPITTFAGGTNWSQVACGYNHTAAIKTDGTLWTWGRGTNGQLGNASTTNAVTPVTTFAGGTNWKQVDIPVSGNTTIALEDDGVNRRIYLFGANSQMQLGNNPGSTDIIPLQLTLGGTNWKQVSGGDSFTAAIKTDGTLWTWGNGNNGQRGDLTSFFPGSVSTPVTTFAGGTNWRQVFGSYNHAIAVTYDDPVI